MHLVSTWRGRGALVSILAVAAMGLTMILAAAPVTEAQTAPSVEIKQLTLTGGEEVPPVTANAIGYFSATLTDGNLAFDLSGVATEITQAHLHNGAKGVNGPVVAFLFGPVDPGVGAIHPTGNIKVANLVGPLAGNWKGFTDALAKGEIYANIHTKANPAGVMRAQIPATTLAPLTPVVPKPPATGDTFTSPESIGITQAAGAALVAGAFGTLAFAVSRRRA